MRTHLGCTGRIHLGELSRETQRRLEQVDATWLDFSPDPPSLVVRHVQPDAISPPREIAGELLEFLTQVSDVERRAFPGGALYYLDEQTGQYLRLRVWRGGELTISWAHPSYEDAKSVIYEGQATPVVFEPYQCLNGSVSLTAKPGAADEIRSAIERPAGLCPQGEYEIHPIGEVLGLELREVNSSVVPLVETLRQVAVPGSLNGQIDVSSFRAGDLDDYCRFVFKNGEVRLLRASLWSDAPADRVTAEAV
ncbi:MAG: hypothetical protein P8Z30_04665 [Acidobacteriota bacterium]